MSGQASIANIDNLVVTLYTVSLHSTHRAGDARKNGRTLQAISVVGNVYDYTHFRPP
jgi:hypothetical protein